MTINEWIQANSILIILGVSILLLICFIREIIQGIRRRLTKRQRPAVSPLPYILLMLGYIFFIYILFSASEIKRADWAQILLMIGLVIITAVYASSTHKMAEEMREQRVMSSRPVIIQKAIPTAVTGSGFSDQFEIYNAGNGPAIELEILLLDKDEKLLSSERETFLRAGDPPITFYPHNLASHVNSTCYLLCQYQSILSRGIKPSWYQTWLPFKPVKSVSRDYIYVESAELKFEQVFEKKSY